MMKAGGNIGPLTRTSWTGAAWLSSARALKCSLKWGNERNPYYALHVSRETAPPKDENYIVLCRHFVIIVFGRGGRRG